MKNIPTNYIEFNNQFKRVFSPSGSGRWLFCTGSVGLDVELRKQEPESAPTSSIYASEGTCAHHLGAKCIKGDISPYNFINDEIAAEDGTPYKTTVNLEMANAVNIYVDFVLSLARKSSNSILEVEQTLDLTGISPYVFSGTSDAWVYNPETKHLDVCDLKYGQGVFVEVENNTQLMIYALGVTQKLYRSYRIPLNEISGITLHIIQPRVNNGSQPIRSWDLSPQVLPWFHEFILSAVKSAFSPSPVFSPSEHRCRWCPGSSRCPARAEQAIKAAQLDFDHLVNHAISKDQTLEIYSPVGQMFEAIPEPTLPPVQLLSITELSVVLRWKKRIENFLGDVSEYAKQLRVQGNRVPGFKLVRGRSIRQWKSEKEAMELAQAFVPKEEMYSKPKLLSPAQMEELFKKKKLQMSLLESVIVKPEGELTLAPIEDPRAEVQPLGNASQEFAQFANKD